MVDCGLFQGNRELKERNYDEFPFNPADIDFVILTHAHVDHSGLIPKLFLHGFNGPVYGTEGTVALCEIVLPDCGHIQEMEIERKNRKKRRAGDIPLEPIYTAKDAYACLNKFISQNYNEEFSPAPGINVFLREAGHILGSSMLEISYTENKSEKHLLLTGDIGRPFDFIVRQPQEVKLADFIIMESTYGNRIHKVKYPDVQQLAQIISETFAAGGNVVIPAFAIDRTQDLIMIMGELVEKGKLQEHNIYVDSPLAIAATEIFNRFPEYFNETMSKRYHLDGTPFSFPGLIYSRTVEESMAINEVKSRAIIISASGMADSGRIKHHLKHNLWRQESTIVFIGYQAEGTLGRRLLEGVKSVKIHGEEIQVEARIVSLNGFSAHADRDELLNWVKNFVKKPTSIFVTHGEEQSSLDFASSLEELGVTASVPSLYDKVDLSSLQKKRQVVAGFIRKPSLVGDKLLADIVESLEHMAKNNQYDNLLLIQQYLDELATQQKYS